ncbi:MAG: 23S rRNA (adenine(2030)-N(6))-methyltransferase RlmJ [Pseudomonadota bacterium]
MNYRHAYHAGNFADVVKHTILLRVIAYLQRKDAGILMLDTHAGIGRYDLSSAQAQKTNEADLGIGKFFAHPTPFAAEIERLFKAYKGIVNALNEGEAIRTAPGSPEILSCSRRPQDRCVFNELHPEDCATLASNYAGKKKIEIAQMDAWTALRAKLPPAEKRGLVLIDPPFEKTTEADDLLLGVYEALRRFSTGTYLIWYPLKDSHMSAQLRRGVEHLPVSGALDTQLHVSQPHEGRFHGTGMIILNPPFTLFDELQLLLPALAKRLSVRPDRGNWATAWLIRPK